MLILINLGYIHKVDDWLDAPGNLYIGKTIERDDLGLTLPCSEWANFHNLPSELYIHSIMSNVFFIRKILDGYLDKYKYIACFCDTVLPCHGHFIIDTIHDIKKQTQILFHPLIYFTR